MRFRNVYHGIPIQLKTKAGKIRDRKTAILRYQARVGADILGEQLPHDLVSIVHFVKRRGNLI